jgi:hypothetical protein
MYVSKEICTFPPHNASSVFDILETEVQPNPLLSNFLSDLIEDSTFRQNNTDVSIKDASLTSRLLKLLGKKARERRNKTRIGNSQTAGSYTDSARLLIISISIYNQLCELDLLREGRSDKTWQRLLKTANAAQHIATKTDALCAEKAYITALLYDLGRLFLEKYLPEKSAEAEILIMDGSGILEAEREVYGTDHQEVGYWVASKWNLPESLIEVMGNHHIDKITALPNLPKPSIITLIADILISENNILFNNSMKKSPSFEILKEGCDCFDMSIEEIRYIYGTLPKHLFPPSDVADIECEQMGRCFLNIDNESFALYENLASMFSERRKLSRQMLQEGRLEGTLDSLKIALATLSHYLNNAITRIEGQGEILRQLYEKGEEKEVLARIPNLIDSNKNATQKISIVLRELSKISSPEMIEYFRHSKAIDVEKSLKKLLD